MLIVLSYKNLEFLFSCLIQKHFSKGFDRKMICEVVRETRSRCQRRSKNLKDELEPISLAMNVAQKFQSD